MMPIWDQWGERHAVTVLHMPECVVSQCKTQEREGYSALQLAGGGEQKRKRMTKPVAMHFEKNSIPYKHTMKEFRVTPDAMLPVGTVLDVRHFVPGQFVDVQGTTIGKGFQGVMKKWGFKGLRASHGVSKAHRSQGSIGGCQDPGKVFKGKKMAGQMGNRTRTTQNVRVMKVDPAKRLIYLKGAVPGHAGNLLFVKDATRKTFENPPPFPTFTPRPHNDPLKALDWQPPVNPFAIGG